MDLLFLLVWLALCAEQDARQRQISNWLTLGALALALTYLLISGHTWLGATAAEGGWALLLSLALTLPGYALGKLGGADVKLLAALALATDCLYLLGTFIGAALAMLLWMATRQKIYPHMNQWLASRYIHMNTASSNKYPFAPFAFVGFCLFLMCFHQS
jgi:prepilin peptidase CpaA